MNMNTTAKEQRPKMGNNNKNSEEKKMSLRSYHYAKRSHRRTRRLAREASRIAALDSQFRGQSDTSFTTFA